MTVALALSTKANQQIGFAKNRKPVIGGNLLNEEHPVDMLTRPEKTEGALYRVAYWLAAASRPKAPHLPTDTRLLAEAETAQTQADQLSGWAWDLTQADDVKGIDAALRKAESLVAGKDDTVAAIFHGMRQAPEVEGGIFTSGAARREALLKSLGLSVGFSLPVLAVGGIALVWFAYPWLQPLFAARRSAMDASK